MVRREFYVTERRACRALGISRSSIRYVVCRRPDEEQIRHRILELAAQYGRYGYRQICRLLRNEGYIINFKRVERIWREEGLKLPQKQPKRSRLWLNDGSTVRLRPEHRNHVWSYDFVSERLSNGKTVKILNVIDEYTRECLASIPKFSFKSAQVKEVLIDLFFLFGVPKHIRSDNGSEFIANHLKQWFDSLDVGPLYIEPGSPWENGYIESFNGKMRYEFLNGEIFDTLTEMKVLLNRWRTHYNTVRPHSSLQGRPPAPQTHIFSA